MLEGEVLSGKELKYINYFNDLKAEAIDLSQRIYTFDEKLGDRMEKCGDHIRLHRFKSGFLKFHKAWFCHVHLCPLCESGEIKKRYAKSFYYVRKALDLNYKIVVIEITHKIEIKTNAIALINNLTRISQRFVQTKNNKPKGYIRTITVDAVNNQCVIKVNYIAAFSPGNFGKNYLKNSRLKEMWCNSLSKSGINCDRCGTSRLLLVA